MKLKRPMHFKYENSDLLIIYWTENIPIDKRFVRISKKEYDRLYNKFFLGEKK